MLEFNNIISDIESMDLRLGGIFFWQIAQIAMSMHNTPPGYLRSDGVNPREAPSENLLSEKLCRSPHYFQVAFRITDDS